MSNAARRREAGIAWRPADAARLFSALGDETRVRLLDRLCTQGPGSTSQLTARANVSRQAVAKHLAVLSDAGVVRSRRDGRERIWEVRPQRFDDAQQYLDRVSRRWDDALDRLRRLVEE